MIFFIIILSITFNYFLIQIETRQDSIIDQEIEIANLKSELTSVQSDLENLKQNEAIYVGKYKITYYCPCKECCGKEDKITASGQKAQEGITVAADISNLPFGTKIYISGIGWRIVQDKGSAIKGNRLDIYVSSHSNPMPYNVQNLDVWVIN